MFFSVCDYIFRANNGLLMTPCYTANFVAPEVLKRQGYDEACDIWSCGVLLYAMLSGVTPFARSHTDTPEEILARIGEGKFDLTSGNWINVSPIAKDLVQRMLHVDPARRLRAAEVLMHPFISNRSALPQAESLSNASGKMDPTAMKTGLGLIFRAVNSPPNNQLSLEPINQSQIAKRRAAQKRSQSSE